MLVGTRADVCVLTCPSVLGYNCNNHGTIRLSTLNNLQSYSSGNSAGNIHTAHCCFVQEISTLPTAALFRKYPHCPLLLCSGNIHTAHCCFVSASDWSLWVPPLVMMSLLRFRCPQWTFCSIHLRSSPPVSFLLLTQSMWLQVFSSLLSNQSLQIQYLAFVFPLWQLVPHL